MAKKASAGSRARAKADDETPRRPLYAELTPTAYDAWNEFADRYGCSVTAVLEAMGQELITSKHWKHTDIGDFPPQIRSVLEHARVIGAERRRRKK